jgi:hypothetical protein
MEHNHMVQALPPNGTNHPLNVSSLPGGARCAQHFVDAHASHLFSEVIAEDGIAIAQQVAREFPKAAWLDTTDNKKAPSLSGALFIPFFGLEIRSPNPRHQFSQQSPNILWSVFPLTAFECIRTLESIRPANLHLPPIIRLRADNQNPPISWPIRQRVLDARNHVCLHVWIASVVHLYGDGHCTLSFPPFHSSGWTKITIHQAWEYYLNWPAHRLYDSQARQPQLGQTHATRSSPSYRIWNAGQAITTTPHVYASSHELRRWCERNRNRCYIPEWLLDAWDIPVDPEVAA